MASNAGPAKILLVEDNLLTKKTVGLFLRAEGYEVDEAEDGRRALSLLQGNQYDLILSDIALPHFNGFDLLERAAFLSARTPVILMTAYIRMPSEVTARGAAELILKPFSLDDLLLKIRQTLARRRS